MVFIGIFVFQLCVLSWPQSGRKSAMRLPSYWLTPSIFCTRLYRCEFVLTTMRTVRTFWSRLNHARPMKKQETAGKCQKLQRKSACKVVSVPMRHFMRSSTFPPAASVLTGCGVTRPGRGLLESESEEKGLMKTLDPARIGSTEKNRLPRTTTARPRPSCPAPPGDLPAPRASRPTTDGAVWMFLAILLLTILTALFLLWAKLSTAWPFTA